MGLRVYDCDVFANPVRPCMGLQGNSHLHHMCVYHVEGRSNYDDLPRLNARTAKGGENMRKKLKLLRVEKGLTQEEIAFLLGVTRTTYCNIENGKSKGSMTFWLGLKRAFPEIDIDEMAKIEGETA